MMTLRLQIEAFLNQYDGFICIEDLHSILNFLNIHDIYENQEKMVSIYGEHFTNCPWSEDDCLEGPDTCNCVIYRFRKNCIINIMQMYHKYQNE